MLMPQEALKDFIKDTRKNDCFDFSPAAIGAILKLAERWQEKWTTVFKRILIRIKTGRWLDDAENADGKYVPLPISDKEDMAVFFKPSQGARYLIYGLKIMEKKEG